MRHDPAGGAIVFMFRDLKIHEMAKAGTDLMAHGDRGGGAPRAAG